MKSWESIKRKSGDFIRRIKDKISCRRRIRTSFTDDALGLQGKEQVELFYLLVRKYLGTIINVTNIQAVEKEQEFTDEKVQEKQEQEYKLFREIMNSGTGKKDAKGYFLRFIDIYGAQYKLMRDFKRIYEELWERGILPLVNRTGILG